MSNLSAITITPYPPVLSPSTEIDELVRKFESVSGPVLLSIIAVLSVIFLFVGQRILKVFLFCSSFFLLAGVCYAFLINRVANLAIYYKLLISVVLGLAGGIVAVCILQLGCIVIGAYFGFVIASVLLSIHVPGFSFVDIFAAEWQMYLFIAALVVVGAAVCAMRRCQRILLVLVTAVVGAFGVVYVADHFAGTGFADVVEYICAFVLYKNKPHLTSAVWAFIAAWAALSIIGSAVQFRWTGRQDDHRLCRHQPRENSRRDRELSSVGA
eukprot:TRINITY_DN12905_c0_g1_i1.p1 TRINITY_DN12905_c0_g1~~TRINITY_DN12905_c0_g1_i1.p1  ORF type:complete len:269 (-),score=47.44 TRINITY_DN12905_c0_g1_i1:320-1126(-)